MLVLPDGGQRRLRRELKLAESARKGGFALFGGRIATAGKRELGHAIGGTKHRDTCLFSVHRGFKRWLHR